VAGHGGTSGNASRCLRPIIGGKGRITGPRDQPRPARRLDYDEAADPEGLAKVIADEIGRPVDYLPFDTGGAARAAASIAKLV